MKKVKKEPEAGRKREQILEVASQMFMSEGYGSVSMDKLAEAVPVSKRTLYNNFSDKAAIFGAVMESRCQTVFSTLQQGITKYSTPEETLTLMADIYLSKFMQPNAVNMYRTAITESKQFPELSKMFYEAGPKRGLKLLTSYFQALDDDKKLRIPNPELAAKMFIGMVMNRVHMEFMLGVRKTLTAKEKTEMVRYAVRIFLHGHKA